MALDPETQRRIDDLQNKKAVLDAQKALADSQNALENSRKALDQADNGSAQQLTDLANQKALIDAQKALVESQNQALLAKLIGGDVKAGPFSGSVTMNDKAGTQEAALLAAQAVREAAVRVAGALPDNVQNILISPAKDFPGFQRLLGFRLRRELIKQAFAAAGIQQPPAPAALQAEALPISAALISAGLDAFSNLLGFFKTDFTVGGTDVKLDESLLLFAVAGRLSGRTVRLPLTHDPGARVQAVAAIAAQLADLLNLRASAAAEAAKSNDKSRVDQLNAVIALYDSFASGLITPDSNGNVPIVSLAQEFSIDSALSKGFAVLLVRLESAGGGFLVKKNLFTGLGAMPLFHTGGATVTYVLLDGSSGRVLAGDVVPVHGGFVRSDKLRETLSARAG
jgi:hypothetical protein